VQSLERKGKKSIGKGFPEQETIHLESKIGNIRAGRVRIPKWSGVLYPIPPAEHFSIRDCRLTFDLGSLIMVSSADWEQCANGTALP